MVDLIKEIIVVGTPVAIVYGFDSMCKLLKSYEITILIEKKESV